MCLRCDGYTEEEVERALDLTISVHGYSVQQIRNPGGPDWTYTIGLTETWGHPELLCVQVDGEMSDQLVWRVGQMVAKQREVNRAELAADDIELVPVHPVHLEGDLVGSWCNRYGELPLEGAFLQVLPGPSWFCACHARSVSRLDSPAPFEMPRLNRAARRAAKRKRRSK